MTVTPILTDSSIMRGHYAGFVSRTVAFLIDLLAVVSVQFIVVLVIRLVFNFLGLNSLMEALGSSGSPGGLSDTVALIITWIAAFLGSMFFFGLYAAFLWTLIDKTLGQALLGLRVLRTNGDRLTFARSVRRAIGYFLASLPLFIGFLWVLVDDRRQGWHDKLADTVVVYDWDARLGRRWREWLARQSDTHSTPVVAPLDPQDIHTSG